MPSLLEDYALIGGGDHLVARDPGRRAQLGLPLLLAALAQRRRPEEYDANAGRARA
jgi:hypothetical protein